MTNPITPPPELVEKWVDMLSSRSDQAVFTMAAQWAAAQELEACCEWLARNYNYPEAGNPLRAARRPKPPSLKEQAQAELDRLIALIPTEGAMAMSEPIRRALEQLTD